MTLRLTNKPLPAIIQHKHKTNDFYRFIHSFTFWRQGPRGPKKWEAGKVELSEQQAAAHRNV